jgi:hypothetical protein
MLRRLGGRGMDSNWFRIYPPSPAQRSYAIPNLFLVR